MMLSQIFLSDKENLINALFYFNRKNSEDGLVYLEIIPRIMIYSYLYINIKINSR